MTGVLVMAYGSPQGSDDVLRYYTHIRHGRAPNAEQMANLRMRYEAIGGFSPLTAITQRQAQGLQKALDRLYPGAFGVFLALKHTPPFIADTVLEMAHAGIDHFVALVLAPHYSPMSVGAYFRDIEDTLHRHNLSMAWYGILSWHTEALFITLITQRLRRAWEKFTPDELADLVTVFTAHSLPQKILESQDPYPFQLQETGELVARQMGLARYRFSWQSAGRTKEPWMKPDIVDAVRLLASEGHKAVLVCPVGFVSDHLEVLYDLDIECRQAAQQAGVHMERTSSFNDDPNFLAMLAKLVARTTQTPFGMREP